MDNTTLFKVFRHLYLVKNTDNSIIWSKESDFYTLPVVATDGTIYISGVDEKGEGKLFAFDKNGKQKWTFKNDLGAPTEVIINLLKR